MIIGHKKQWDFLKNKLEQNQLSHAYLFVGPESIGKTKFAIEFAKIISCKDSNYEKGEQMIEKKQHPDVLVVEPKGAEIQIAQIRGVQQFLSLKPYYSSFKIVIIDQAQKMNQEAQNCFLKTLEEPKGNTLLILLSAYPEVMLPTILSRCQTIKFFSVSQKEIKEYLLKNNVSEKKTQELSFLSNGKPGRVINILTEENILEKEKENIKKIAEVCQADLAAKFQYIKGLPEQEFGQALTILRKYLRHVLFLKIGIDNNPKGLDYFPEMSDKFKEMPVLKIKKIIELIEKMNFYLLTTNVNQKLALETLLLEI